MKKPQQKLPAKDNPPISSAGCISAAMKFPSPLNRHFFTKIRGNDVKVIIRLAESGWVGLRWSGIPESLVGGWTAQLKNMSQIGSFPQIGVKIKNLWNHQLDHNHWFFRLDFSVWFDVHPFFFWWSADLVTSDLRFFGDLLVELNCKCWSPFLAGSQQPTFLQQQPAHLDAVHHKLWLQTELPRRGWTKENWMPGHGFCSHLAFWTTAVEVRPGESVISIHDRSRILCQPQDATPILPTLF